MKYILLLLVIASTMISAKAQNQTRPDTAWLVQLPEQRVAASRIWENDTVQYHYNQTKLYVETVLPYALAAAKSFQEIQNQMQALAGEKKKRKTYLAKQEELIKNKFENQVKKLNTTQGVLLIKLIARQSGLNIYHMLAETKGGFTALRYDAWARLQGFKLNQKYQPQEEPMLEHIMEGLGYPLPQNLAAK